MKLLRHLLVLGLAALAFQPSAKATVAIYSGTEQQLQIDDPGNAGTGNTGGVRRFTGRIYFIYEIETGRSVEIRVQGNSYKVREERNLLRVAFHRSAGSKTMVQTFLSNGNRVDGTSFSTVSLVSWEGTASFSGPGPDVEVATGLPRGFARILTSRQQVGSYEKHDAGNYLTRRNDTASLIVAMTKASNAAGENFEAALQRVKNTLAAQGKTEVTTLEALD